MSNLKIKKENADKAFNEGTASDKQLLKRLFPGVFEPLDIREVIKTVRDAFNHLNKDYDAFLAKCKADGDEDDEIAYKELKVINQALNEGATFDWGNSNQWKYYPWFDMGGSSGSSFALFVFACQHSESAVGSRLCFKSSELAEYAGKQFVEVYKRFFLIK